MTRSIARPTAAAVAEWIKPQLTKLVDAPPDGPEWLHEIKFDGYRMHARLDRDAVRLLSRTGLDWTLKYPSIVGGRTTRRSEYHVVSAWTAGPSDPITGQPIRPTGGWPRTEGGSGQSHDLRADVIHVLAVLVPGLRPVSVKGGSERRAALLGCP